MSKGDHDLDAQTPDSVDWWTGLDGVKAQRDGWDLSGAMHNGVRAVRIVRSTPYGSKHRFSSSGEALRYVKHRADQGNLLCAKAINILIIKKLTS